ncbi:MAG: ATP-binding protein [Eubacteriales bacterium]
MREISEHILDITQNSVVANADEISIRVSVDTDKDQMTIVIADNGKGMDETLLRSVLSPFTTSRTTRKVGLGLPMFRETALSADGHFDIVSVPGKGTTVTAEMQVSHIDRPPLGALADTLHILITSNPDLSFKATMAKDGQEETLDTKEVKAILGDVPLNNPEVSAWIRESLIEMNNKVFGGEKI